MVPESTETPGTEGKERIHPRRGHIYDTYGIPSDAYEKQNYHPKARIPQTKTLDIEAIKYYDRLRDVPDKEYLESNYQDYVRSVVEDFCTRTSTIWELSKVSTEFYFLTRGTSIGRRKELKSAQVIFKNYNEFNWVSQILEDLDTITFLIYRLAIKRHRPLGQFKIRPFYYYLNVTTFSYLGNYLGKNIGDLTASYYEELPEIQSWDLIEDITTYQQASNWPNTYERISYLSGIHPKSAHFIFTRNGRDNSYLAKEGYFSLRSKNVSNPSKQQAKLVQNRREYI
jgi:hypothetical protein